MINANDRLLVISTSTIYGYSFLEYIKDEIKEFIKSEEIIFVPYARPSGVSYDDYTQNVKDALEPIGISVKGLHTFENRKEAIQHAKAIFIGGGNTFLLLKTLYEQGLVEELRNAVHSGTP